MAFDFPSSPTNGQEFTPPGGPTYVWNGYGWRAKAPVGGTGFSTGDAKITLKTTADTGWVMMDDGTIGSATSGASTRANADTQALFTLLFNNINDTNAPIKTSAGAATTRAAQTDAATAWANNCRISLTRQLGRALGVAGAGAGLTNRALGGFLGEETHTPTLAEMFAHAHGGSITSPYSFCVWYNTLAMDGGSNYITFQYANNSPSNTLSIAAQGSSSPANQMQPTTFWNVMVKL